MKSFSLLYRVFYDRSLPVAYVRDGKGWGGRPMFALSIFFAFVLSLKVFFLFSGVSNADVAGIAAQMPEISVVRGRIASPTDYAYKYISPQKDVFFIFDTTGGPPSFDKLPPRGIFLSKSELTSVSPTERRTVPLDKVLSYADFTLTRENMGPVFQQTLTTLRRFIPPVLFVFWVPLSFVFYFFAAVFYAMFSFFLVKENVSFDFRLRLAVLSMLPAYVFNALASILNLNVRLGIGLAAVLTLGFMFCFFKELGKAPPRLVKQD